MKETQLTKVFLAIQCECNVQVSEQILLFRTQRIRVFKAYYTQVVLKGSGRLYTHMCLHRGNVIFPISLGCAYRTVRWLHHQQSGCRARYND